MFSDPSRTTSHRPHPSSRRVPPIRSIAVSAALLTAAVLGGTAMAGPAGAAALPSAADARCMTPATYATEIQWGGSDAPWHADSDLTLLIANRRAVVARDTVPVGTRVTWSGPNGSGSITFFDSGHFTGSAQFPGEGPVGYRGSVSARDTTGASSDKPTCKDATMLPTEIQWGGSDAPWHADSDLTLLIANRRGVVARGASLVGTQVSWSGPNGSANITFFSNADFSGTAQFPDEGPVGYRSAGYSATR